MTRRLRIAHVVVQPVLVWDDGEELSPGPQANPRAVPLADLATLADTIRGELPAVQASIEADTEAPA